MFSYFRRSDRDKRDQNGPQLSTNMSLSDDGDQATLVATYHGGASTEQQPAALSANPDEHTAEVFVNPVITKLQQVVSVVLGDLDAVIDRVQEVREKAFRRQTSAGYVLHWGQGANSILQKLARSKGQPRPPFLDPSAIEEEMRQSLRDLEHLQRDLGGQVQAAQDVYDHIQQLRRGDPTLSPDYNFLSEHELQERLARFDAQQHALQQQEPSLRSTYQSLKDWNRSPAAPVPENRNVRQVEHRYQRHVHHE